MSDSLAESIARIRGQHAPPPPETRRQTTGNARREFERFLPELQEALRIAAQRHGWDGETRAYQTLLVADAIERSGYAIGAIRALADAYRNPPPPPKEGASA